MSLRRDYGYAGLMSAKGTGWVYILTAIFLIFGYAFGWVIDKLGLIEDPEPPPKQSFEDWYAEALDEYYQKEAKKEQDEEELPETKKRVKTNKKISAKKSRSYKFLQLLEEDVEEKSPSSSRKAKTEKK